MSYNIMLRNKNGKERDLGALGFSFAWELAGHWSTHEKW